MTREKQIRQAGIEYTYRNRPMCIGGAFSEIVDELNRDKSFEEGAKWADATMIEKACEYLKANMQIPENVGNWYIESFIQQFRKAMEE